LYCDTYIPKIVGTVGYELSQVYNNDANEHLAIAERVENRLTFLVARNYHTFYKEKGYYARVWTSFGGQAEVWRVRHIPTHPYDM
jgi:5-deoxy-D-glucuronate isomerase